MECGRLTAPCSCGWRWSAPGGNVAIHEAQKGDSIASYGPRRRPKFLDNQISYSLMPRVSSQILFSTHGETELRYDQGQEFEYESCSMQYGHSLAIIHMIGPGIGTL